MVHFIATTWIFSGFFLNGFYKPFVRKSYGKYAYFPLDLKKKVEKAEKGRDRQREVFH